MKLHFDLSQLEKQRRKTNDGCALFSTCAFPATTSQKLSEVKKTYCEIFVMCIRDPAEPEIVTSFKIRHGI